LYKSNNSFINGVSGKSLGFNPISISERDTFAKKIIECFHVTDDMCQIYDSVVTGSIVEVEISESENVSFESIDKMTFL